MATANRTTVVGVFDDRTQAQQAVNALRTAGFTEAQIGVAARDSDRSTVAESGTSAEEGAVAGLVAGAGVGGLWAVGIAAGLLPAIGPVIAGGILASVLASAATGAAAGAILGALIGLGVPEEEARFYEDEFQAGRVIVTVRSDGRFDEAYAILTRFGAYDVNTRARATAL